MNKTILALLLGTLLTAGTAATAATTIDATGLTLRYIDSTDEPYDMTLLSDNGGTVSIRLNIRVEGNDASWSEFSGVVQQGYRITSFTVSANLTGTLEPAVLPPCPTGAYCGDDEGELKNRAGFAVFPADGGGTGEYWRDITEVTPIALTVPGADVAPSTGEFSFAIEPETSFVAKPTIRTTEYWDYTVYTGYPSHASIAMTDLILTFQVAAVPEPGTYAMLLGGLALVGVAARRRKASAAA